MINHYLAIFRGTHIQLDRQILGVTKLSNFVIIEGVQDLKCGSIRRSFVPAGQHDSIPTKMKYISRFLLKWKKKVLVWMDYAQIIIPGGRPKNGTVDTVDFSGLCSNQQLSFSPCWVEHLFLIIITPRSSNLVENFLFYEHFLWTVIFEICPFSRVPRND